MTLFSQSTRTLLIGGLLFLIPVLLLIILTKKALQLFLPIGHKVATLIGIETLFGAATVTIVSIILLFVLCFLGGLLVQKSAFRQWSTKMEEQLFSLFPTFQMIKYQLINENNYTLENSWEPILLQDKKEFRIAFITDRSNAGYFSIFIPDAPRIESGELRYIPVEYCIYFPISMRQAMRALSGFGKGLPLQKLTKTSPNARLH